MNRRILITGATSGIGNALAHRLAPRGELLLAGRRPADEARGILPSSATYAQADQTDPAGCAAALVAALDAMGWDGLDLAVLNAGLGHAVDPRLEEAAALRAVLDANLMAPVAIAQALLPRLEVAGGKLVLIGSTARRGAPGFASYAASKAGLHGFARALAEEWRGRVAVQVIHPGPTATGMHARAGHDPGGAARFFARPATMAALMEEAMATNRSAVSLSFARFLFRRRPA